MNEKLVSVVITTYKREQKYVKEALNSVLNQTYQNIEVILVDDNGMGSEYGEALKRLCCENQKVTYLQNEKNSGAQFSRNQGIMKSKGEYVAFLDDDDIWSETKIEKQMKLFTDDSIGMVFCDGYSFEDGDMNKLGTFREVSIFDRPISHEMELFNDYIGSTSQVLIKKECFSKVGIFDCDMPARQDYEMWLRISRHYLIVGVPEPLLFYRVHAGERISKNLKKCFDSYILLLDKYKKDYKKNKYAKSKLILRLFTTSIEMKSTKNTIKYFMYAFVTSPKCVIDVIRRKISKKEFNDFYKDMI